MTQTSPRTTFHAVLPLATKGVRDDGDLARAELQGRSFRHFFRRDERIQISVVARASELSQVAGALKPLETDWLKYNLVDETAVHPALTESPVAGWHKQQIIKMAAPEWLGANFWMTLDADVLCTKPIGTADLLPGGRALLFADELRIVPIFEQWARATREFLGMMAPPLSVCMGVTPLIYAAPIMRAAYQAIEAVHGRPWKDVLLDPKTVPTLSARHGASWAEHHIYYAVAARLGLLRAYHAFSGIDAPQRLHGHGVWRAEDWPSWDVAQAFDVSKPGFFAVCNSYTGMPVSAVADKIAPFLAKEPPAPQPASPAALYDDGAEREPQGDDVRVQILARRPFVVMGPYDDRQPNLRNVLSREVLDPLRYQPALVLVGLPWNREHVQECRMLAARIARRQREAPLHRFVVLANTDIEAEVMRQFGHRAVVVSRAALLDERPFLGDATGEPEFDAVYNAGFHPAKRHQLAAAIPSLALIYADWHNLPDYGDYAEQAKRALPQATHLNLQEADGSYAFIPRETLAGQLQRARVGLCLSEAEGAMRAAAEYLFAGLPVVSTFSTGGRDQLFDDEFCAVVPPSAELVAAAVRELAGRKLPRQDVRRRTLHRLAPHRERLMQLVMQSIADIGQAPGDAAGAAPQISWPWLGEERTVRIGDFHRELRGEAAIG